MLQVSGTVFVKIVHHKKEEEEVSAIVSHFICPLIYLSMHVLKSLYIVTRTFQVGALKSTMVGQVQVYMKNVPAPYQRIP